MVSQAYQLALASGVCALHGPLLRDLTAGQLPVTALMSSDNGKAQVVKITSAMRSLEEKKVVCFLLYLLPPPNLSFLLPLICMEEELDLLMIHLKTDSDLKPPLKTHSRKKVKKCNQCDFVSSYINALMIHLPPLKTHSRKSKINATNVTLRLLT